MNKPTLLAVENSNNVVNLTANVFIKILNGLISGYYSPFTANLQSQVAEQVRILSQYGESRPSYSVVVPAEYWRRAGGHRELLYVTYPTEKRPDFNQKLIHSISEDIFWKLPYTDDNDSRNQITSISRKIMIEDCIFNKVFHIDSINSISSLLITNCQLNSKSSLSYGIPSEIKNIKIIDSNFPEIKLSKFCDRNNSRAVFV